MADTPGSVDFRPGQAYWAPGPGLWVVEAVYKGPAVIFADARTRVPTGVGFLHLANRDLGIRAVIRLDDPVLDKLKRA